MLIIISNINISEGRKSLGKWDFNNNCYINNNPFPIREKSCPISRAFNDAGFKNSHFAHKLFSDNFEPVELPKVAHDWYCDLTKNLPTYPIEFEVMPTAKN